MPSALYKAFGYRGDAMNLPVANLEASIPFYESRLGFRVVSRTAGPPRAAVLERDGVQMGLAENGGDPSQDGCAFHVASLDELRAEFQSAGLDAAASEVRIERHGKDSFRVFFVVAPDGLCYWFGERQSNNAAPGS
jgi:lactoylglutathione lyase